MILLTLPMPPTINDYYGYNKKSGRRYVKKEGKLYREAIIKLVREKGWDFRANVPIAVEVLLNFGNRRRNDVDNRCKGLLDALTHALVYEDDSLIDDLHLRRGRLTGEPNVKITIQAMEDMEE